MVGEREKETASWGRERERGRERGRKSGGGLERIEEVDRGAISVP